MHLHPLKINLRHGSERVEIGDNTKSLFSKYHIIHLFFKGRCHGVYISVSLGYT